jgi:hypothetical protein
VAPDITGNTTLVPLRCNPFAPLMTLCGRVDRCSATHRITTDQTLERMTATPLTPALLHAQSGSRPPRTCRPSSCTSLSMEDCYGKAARKTQVMLGSGRSDRLHEERHGQS